MSNTPAEKAKDLVEKFTPLCDYQPGHIHQQTANAKACALILVDEIMSLLDKLKKPEYATFIEWDQLKEKELADTMDGYEYKEFYEWVKEEINKL